jgi:hypothetical protein
VCMGPSTRHRMQCRNLMRAQTRCVQQGAQQDTGRKEVNMLHDAKGANPTLLACTYSTTGRARLVNSQLKLLCEGNRCCNANRHKKLQKRLNRKLRSAKITGISAQSRQPFSQREASIQHAHHASCVHTCFLCLAVSRCNTKLAQPALSVKF